MIGGERVTKKIIPKSTYEAIVHREDNPMSSITFAICPNTKRVIRLFTTEDISKYTPNLKELTSLDGQIAEAIAENTILTFGGFINQT